MRLAMRALDIAARVLLLAASVVLLAVGAVSQNAQSCAVLNQPAIGSGFSYFYSNPIYHITGLHSMNATNVGSCYYSNSGGIGSICNTLVVAADNPTGNDTGLVISFTHVVKVNQVGSKSGGKGGVSTTARAGVAAEQCFFGICNFSVSLPPVSVSSGTPIWTAEDDYNAYCPQQVEGCPIILDVTGEGFQLTDAVDGVDTDMVIPGRRMRFGWTKRGSHNAFLWLDNHLFGNWTSQPPTDNPNGFAALAVYDSNGDGVIDAKDPVFKDLRLWIDANHDGVTQPEELFTLPSLGVYSISLKYHLDHYIDEWGNHFRYKGHLTSAAIPVDHTVYDVFLSSDLREQSWNPKDLRENLRVGP